MCSLCQKNKKAMKSFDFTAFSGAMEGTRTPGLLIRSQSLYPAELPTHTFRPEQDVFYHSAMVLSTPFAIIFILFDRNRFSHVRTAFFTGFLLRPSPCFLPAACAAGLRFGIFALFLLYGHPAADALRPQGLRTFSGKKPFKAQNQHFL